MDDEMLPSHSRILAEAINTKILTQNHPHKAFPTFPPPYGNEIKKEVFQIQNPASNFGSEATHFKRENVKTTNFGIQSVRYLGPKIQDMVPNNIKNYNSLNKFKKCIKSWKLYECPFRLCKKYIAHLIYITFLRYI